jgi:hypothetical protein
VAAGGLGEVIDISQFEVVEDEKGTTYAPSRQDIEAFEAIRAMNPKPYRSSGLPTGHIGRKCATHDCGFSVQPGSNSIFCLMCDNERLRPIGMVAERLQEQLLKGAKDIPFGIPSSSPMAEIRRRRKMIDDHRKGISRAVTV